MLMGIFRIDDYSTSRKYFRITVRVRNLLITDLCNVYDSGRWPLRAEVYFSDAC